MLTWNQTGSITPTFTSACGRFIIEPTSAGHFARDDSGSSSARFGPAMLRAAQEWCEARHAATFVETTIAETPTDEIDVPPLSVEADLHQIEPILRHDIDKDGTPRQFRQPQFVHTIRLPGRELVIGTTPARGSQSAARLELDRWLAENNAVRMTREDCSRRGDAADLLTPPGNRS